VLFFDVIIFHSSELTVVNDGECLTCGSFSLSESVCFGSPEFIADCIGGMGLSPKGSDPGSIFAGTTHSGSLSLWAMIRDFTDEFYTASSREGSNDLLTSRRHSTVALSAPIATTP
jgi:hypothetical protein